MTLIWRRALHWTVTIKRNTTDVSASGSTKFVYTTVAEGLAASIQDAGGRMRQDEQGQISGKTYSMLFGDEAFGVLQQNDLVVVENGPRAGETFKLYHIHEVIDPNAPHVECSASSWVPGGQD